MVSPLKTRKPATNWATIRQRLARYLLTEIDRTGAEGYHPAAREALFDLGREWLIQTEGRTVLAPMDIIEALRQQGQVEGRACKWCGKEFYPLSRKVRQAYCGNECYHAAAVQRCKEWRKGHRPTGRTCRQCGANIDHKALHAILCDAHSSYKYQKGKRYARRPQ